MRDVQHGRIRITIKIEGQRGQGGKPPGQRGQGGEAPGSTAPGGGSPLSPVEKK